MIVVDGSVLAPALSDDGPEGDQARERLAGEALAAPEIVDLEVASVLRRAALAGRLEERRSAQALADLAALPLRRAPHVPLLPRIWQLRDNATAYDAAYLALAEALDTFLLTSDAKLCGAAGLRCEVELLSPPRPRG